MQNISEGRWEESRGPRRAAKDGKCILSFTRIQKPFESSDVLPSSLQRMFATAPSAAEGKKGGDKRDGTH